MHQDTVYWVDVQLAQRKGSAYCISQALVVKSEEFYQKVYVSPRPPPKISYQDNWMCDLDSDIAGSSKDTQRIEPKLKTQLSSMGRPVCDEEEEIKKHTTFDRATLDQEKHDEVID